MDYRRFVNQVVVGVGLVALACAAQGDTPGAILMPWP
jgi:hypothetical protein